MSTQIYKNGTHKKWGAAVLGNFLNVKVLERRGKIQEKSEVSRKNSCYYQKMG